MGRREGELDPEASPLEAFAHDLRELRRKADVASYRELARRAHYSASALSTAANGRSLPTLAVVEAYVGACGGDQAEWRKRWEELNDLLQAPAPEEPDPAPEPAAPPAPRRRLPVSRRAAVTASITAGVLGAGAVGAVVLTAGSGAGAPVAAPSVLVSNPVAPGTACDGGRSVLAPLPPSVPAGSPSPFQAGRRFTFTTAADLRYWNYWWNPNNLRRSLSTEQTYGGKPALRVEVTPGLTAIGSIHMTGLRAGDVVTVRLAYFGQGAATICPFVQTPKYAEPWVRVRELDLDTDRTTPGWQSYQWTIPAMPVIGTGLEIVNHGLSDVVLYIGEIDW